jgi:hypothetical protein
MVPTHNEREHMLVRKHILVQEYILEAATMVPTAPPIECPTTTTWRRLTLRPRRLRANWSAASASSKSASRRVVPPKVATNADTMRLGSTNTEIKSRATRRPLCMGIMSNRRKRPTGQKQASVPILPPLPAPAPPLPHSPSATAAFLSPAEVSSAVEEHVLFVRERPATSPPAAVSVQAASAEAAEEEEEKEEEEEGGVGREGRMPR